MRHDCIHAVQDENFPILDRWMREVATLLQGFRYYHSDYRPFQEGETANVSLLVAAAAAAGYLPIAENQIDRYRTSTGNFPQRGRADLWLIAGKESFSFEFKQAWNCSETRLRERMKMASDDAKTVCDKESDYYYAGVIAPVISSEFDAVCRSFSRHHLTFRIGSEDVADAYFFFQEAG